MQIKNNYLNQSSILLTIIKIIVLVFVVKYLYKKFQIERISLLSVDWPDNFLAYLVLVFALMVANWSLEAIRWKISVSVFDEISFKQSVLVVLSGLAINWVLPFATGDALVRLITIRDKFKTTSAIALNRGIMLVITMLFGSYSIWFYSKEMITFNPLVLLVLVGVPAVLFFLRRRLGKFMSYFKQLNRKVAVRILLISTFRYFVFVIQLFILLKLFLPEIPNFVLFLGIGWIFFFRSVIPTFFAGIGLREASGIIFFTSYTNDLNLVVVPIFIIWVINNAVPSLTGILAVFKIRHFTQSEILRKKVLSA